MGPNTIPVGPTVQELLELARHQMQEFAGQHLAEVAFPVTTKVLIGNPYSIIIEYAQAQQIDMIVSATHGRGGLSHMLMGSVSEKVVRHAPCPVLTVHHPEHEFVDNVDNKDS